MGFLDAMLGRKKAARPNLDALFSLPNAAITLQVSLDMLPTGRGSVAFRAPEGRAFADVESEVRRLLDADGGPPVRAEQDEFGFTWLVVTSDPVDLPSVVTDLHAVNTSLVEAGFGPQLLCSLVSFRDPQDDAPSRWSTSTSAAPSTRSPRPPETLSSATTCWSFACATCSRASCRSRRR